MNPDPYATLIARGWDTIQEAWPVAIDPPTAAWFDQLKQKANDQGNVREASTAFVLDGPAGPWKVHMRALGAKGGVRWVFGDDEVLILARTMDISHPVSVRYLSLGLWKTGHKALQAKVRDYLDRCTARKQAHEIVTSRADYAFDWLAPAFTPEARTINPKMACVMRHNGAGADFWRADDWDEGDRAADPEGFSYHRRATTQTITMGKLASGSQVQLYSKSAEVNASPSKWWFKDLWKAFLPSLTDDDLGDVWRIECRIGSEYLKRHLLRGTDALERVPGLVPGMLEARRLTIPNTADRTRSRWPTHPLWQQTMDAVSSPAPQRYGRLLLGDYRDHLRRAKLQAAGLLRSLTIMADGAWSSEGFDHLTAELLGIIEDDPDHARKIDGAMERYSMLEGVH